MMFFKLQLNTFFFFRKNQIQSKSPIHVCVRFPFRWRGTWTAQGTISFLPTSTWLSCTLSQPTGSRAPSWACRSGCCFTATPSLRTTASGPSHTSRPSSKSAACFFAFRSPGLTCSEVISRNIPIPCWSRSGARPAEIGPLCWFKRG